MEIDKVQVPGHNKGKPGIRKTQDPEEDEWQADDYEAEETVGKMNFQLMGVRSASSL